MVRNDKVAYSSKTKMIGAKNGDYGYDVFLICSRMWLAREPGAGSGEQG
jgi:hypothetical protein